MLSSRLLSCRRTAGVLARFHRAGLPQARHNSDLAPPPRHSDLPPTRPADLLARLPKDVHAALRAKDKTRLSTLRALLADMTNSLKTDNPITDDLLLLGAIRKRMKSAKESIEMFGQARRTDLVEKEEASLRVLEEYAGYVKTMSDEEIREAVLQVVAGLKEKGAVVNTATVMKACLKDGGPLEFRLVLSSSVAKLAGEAVKSDKNRNAS
jgi:uncharacterized protein